MLGWRRRRCSWSILGGICSALLCAAYSGRSRWGNVRLGGVLKKEFIIIAIAIMGYLIPGVSLFNPYLFLLYLYFLSSRDLSYMALSIN